MFNDWELLLGCPVPEVPCTWCDPSASLDWITFELGYRPLNTEFGHWAPGTPSPGAFFYAHDRYTVPKDQTFRITVLTQ